MLLLVGATIIAVTCFLYLKRYPYYSSPYQYPDYYAPNIPDKIRAHFGYLKFDKNSHFVNFSPVKKDETIRVGCFGASLTAGQEMDELNDYPSHLQKLFRDNGYQNVEIINFASQALLFNHNYLVWKHFGRKFDLDFIILGPDLGTTGLGFFYMGLNPLHGGSRFILDNDELTLVDSIPAKSIDQRYKIFEKLIPYKKTLKYDIRPPAFISCLLPREKRIYNPFYYYPNIKEEEWKLLKLIVNEFSRAKAQIIVPYLTISYSRDKRDRDVLKEYVLYKESDLRANFLFKTLNKNNIFVFQLKDYSHFPYWTVLNHHSSTAYKFFANQIFNVITDRINSPIAVLKTRDLDQDLRSENKVDKIPLSNFEEIAFMVDNQKFGSFVLAIPRFRRSSQKNHVNTHFKKEGTVSLLALRAPGMKILDSCFIQIPFEVTNGMKLKLVLANTRFVKEILLGQIKLIHPAINIGVATIEGISFPRQERLVMYLNSSLGLKRSARPFFSLNNKKILQSRLVGPNQLRIFSPTSLFYRVRVTRKAFLDFNSINSKGKIILNLYRKDGVVLHVPFSIWEKEMINPAVEERTLEKSIGLSEHGRAHIVENDERFTRELHRVNHFLRKKKFLLAAEIIQKLLPGYTQPSKKLELYRKLYLALRTINPTSAREALSKAKVLSKNHPYDIFLLEAPL